MYVDSRAQVFLLVPCAHVRRALWRLLCGSRRLCVLAIELLCGITTSGVVPYPYVQAVSMRYNFDLVRKLHSFSTALSLYPVFHGVAKDYIMHQVFRG